MAAVVQSLGGLDLIANWVSPVLAIFNLPSSVASGVIFSIVRKDGLLILNQDNGDLLRALSVGTVFVLVWLASTLTACTVTLYTIGQELGFKLAGKVALRQMLTALVSTFFITSAVRMLGV